MKGDEVTAQDEAIRKALHALGDDEAEHPGHEVLEAYVEGRLPAEAAAAIDRLAARSSTVAEDIADLRSVRQALGESRRDDAAATRVARWPRFAIGAAIAASLIAAVWIANRTAPAPAQQPA